MVPVNVAATLHVPVGASVSTILSTCAGAYQTYLNNIGLSASGSSTQVDYFTIASLLLQQSGVTKIDNLLIGENASTPVYGTSTGTSTTSLTDTTASWTVNAYTGFIVTSGTSFATVTSNTATVLSLSSWTNGTPASGSSYSITTAPAGTSDLTAAFGHQLIAGAANFTIAQP
jgi:hypothetical protein